MAITQGLQIKQSQSMVMTPQLQQSIQILQYTTLELSAHVAQMVEENPFLDNPDSNTESFEQTQHTDTDEASPKLQDKEALLDRSGDKWADDTVSTAVYEDTDLAYSGVSNFKHNDAIQYDGFEEMASKDQSLREYIQDQINIDIETPHERMIGYYLTDQLDASGYLEIDIKQVAEQLQCKASEITSVLATLQTFDPAGVFATCLSECLALQLKDRNRFDPVIEKLLNHLELIALGDIKKLARLCKTSEEEVIEMCQEIKRLNPKPGDMFATDAMTIQQPDVFLKKTPDGEWAVEVNTQALPKVLVNQKYYAKLVMDVVGHKEQKKYITEQINSANWLVKSMDQRAQSILKISAEILSQQRDFFDKGVRHLKPLILSDVAQQVELHESTVSRVVNGKYIATPMGLYELKYFFSSVVGGGDDKEAGHSSTAVKHMIKDFIDQEDSKKPLSDDKISQLLKVKGVDIARRTVMKYREALHIASSSKRKKMKTFE
jgi:RNA polymerase sigma-54 factor